MRLIAHMLFFTLSFADTTNPYDPLPRHFVGANLLGQKNMLPSMLYVRRRLLLRDVCFDPLITFLVFAMNETRV